MKQEDINKIFDETALYYDKINDFISLGMHKYIKKSCVKMLEIYKNAKVIDLCCGTGDFVKIISDIQPNATVIGLDKSENMLKIAKAKYPDKYFIKADSTALPFEDSSFDFVTIGFGLRNIIDRKKALREIYRVLKSGGKLLHLDFGVHNFLNKVFDYSVPSFIELIGHNKKNYEYLIKSKNNFPEPKALIKEFEKSGLRLLKQKKYIFGSIAAQIMSK